MYRNYLQRKSIALTVFLLILSIFLIDIRQSYADAPGADSFKEPSPQNGSLASFDKRLPPVIPGEEIGTGNKKMKVWSTSGDLAASEPPAAPEFRHRERSPSIGVVVDGRAVVPAQGVAPGSAAAAPTLPAPQPTAPLIFTLSPE